MKKILIALAFLFPLGTGTTAVIYKHNCDVEELRQKIEGLGEIKVLSVFRDTSKPWRSYYFVKFQNGKYKEEVSVYTGNICLESGDNISLAVTNWGTVVLKE